MTSKMTKDTNSRFEAVPPLSELNDGDAAAACDAVPEYCHDVPSCRNPASQPISSTTLPRPNLSMRSPSP